MMFLYDIATACVGNSSHAVAPSREAYLLSAETDDERKDWLRSIKQFLYAVSGGGGFTSLCFRFTYLCF